ncbi:MAG TPA: hypothetical protein VGM37_09370 [Armatimonadota bacterium]|jgi:hypothetical protein
MPNLFYTASEPDWDNLAPLPPDPPGKIILISGSRHHTNLGMVRLWLSRWLPSLPAGTLIRHGGAVGVDQLAGEIAAETTGLIVECILPDYTAYSRPEAWRAPLDSNTVMVAGGKLHGQTYGPASKCLTFPCGVGGRTWDTITKALGAGIPTAVIGEDGRKMASVA